MVYHYPVTGMNTTRKMTREIEIYEIRLDPLYKYGPQFAAEKMLETILKQYEFMEYKMLFAASPDIDVKYLDKNFEQYAKEYLERNPDMDIELAAIEYAKTLCYDLIVLSDGYELAAALIREK
jgi:hypothetical protein